MQSVILVLFSLEKTHLGFTFNPCPAELGHILPLQTVDPDQLASEEAN